MKEIAIDVLFWIGFATSLSFFVLLFVVLVYFIYKSVMDYEKAFKFVFNIAFDRSIKNSSREQMDLWLERCDSKWVKYHDRSGILVGKKVKIVNNNIVISMDVDFLCNTIEMGIGEIEITDKMGFAKDIVSQLLAEKDDGTTLVTEFFDNAGFVTVEDGSTSVILKEES